MINRIIAAFQRPEDGWDPISPQYAAAYAREHGEEADETLVDALEAWIGGFAGKHVLDLGSGPGQYAVAFARRGALVTCHDISRSYLQIAREKAQASCVADRMRFSIGYMDDALCLAPGPWDLVFNRVCWYYAFDDRSFAELIYRLIAPGGYGYIDTHNASFRREDLSLSSAVRTWMNSHLGLKIGHPHPPRGRIEQLLKRHPFKRLDADYSSPGNDRIRLEKPEGAST